MMEYTNDKIKALIKERDSIERKIQFEIEKEKAKYKFSWKRFVLLLLILSMPFAVYINTKIFPDTSIWSWNHYINTGFKH